MGSNAEDKRRNIVEAATRLFSRYGFKRTSVDLLAAEASVAKPTVYAYFTDKDAVFGAVVEAVCDDFLDAARAAAMGDRPIEERLAGMLSAKFTRYFALVQASPHAQELIDSQHRVGAKIIERADRAYVELLEACLGRSELDPSRVQLTVPEAARLLLRVASGAAYGAKDESSHRRHIAEGVRVSIAGMRQPAGNELPGAKKSGTTGRVSAKRPKAAPPRRKG